MPAIEQARAAIKNSDVSALRSLLAEHPALANERSTDNDRTLLHTLADYPGHRLHQIEMAKLLIQAGADPNARFQHPENVDVRETPLHWAASNNDEDLARLLLDAGADIDADGGVIENGTPLWDATIFGCINSARLLIEAGAACNLMTAAAAGDLERVEDFFDDAGEPLPGAGALPVWEKTIKPAQALNSAFGFACAHGHSTLARRLLERGADPYWKSPVGTAIERAREHKHLIIVEFLKQRGIE
jgi:uncharacterized protein